MNKMILFLILFFSYTLASANTPTNLTVTDSTILSLTLNWNSVSGANSYKLYRSDATGLVFTEIANPTQNVYKDSTLQQETKYFYKVSSVVNGVESVQSDSVEGTTRFSNLKLFSIWIDSLDLDSLNSNLPESGKCCYKPATLNVDGVVYNIEAKFKGATKDHWLYDMKSWRLKFDDQNLLDSVYKRINLDNPSSIPMFTENLAYEFFREIGLVMPKSEMVRVKLNGKDHGIHHFYSNDREEEFFEANNIPISELYSEVANTGSFQIWSYLGENSASYTQWEKEVTKPNIPANDFTNLINLLRVLNLSSNEFVVDSLRYLVDIEQYIDFYCSTILARVFHNEHHNLRLYFNPELNKFQQWPNDPAAWGSLIPPDYSPNILAYKLMQSPEIGFYKNKRLYELMNNFPENYLLSKVDSIWLKIKEDAYTDSLKDKTNGDVYTNSYLESKVQNFYSSIGNIYSIPETYLNECEINYSQEYIFNTQNISNGYIPVLNLYLETLPNVASKVSEIFFQATGTGNEVSDIDSVRLYRDNNLNGIIDFGDVNLGVPTSFISDNGTVDFEFNDFLLPKRGTNLIQTSQLPYKPNSPFQIQIEKELYSYILAYKFNNNFDSTKSYLVSIDSSNAIVAHNGITGEIINPQNIMSVVSINDSIAVENIFFQDQILAKGASNFTLINSPNWLSIDSESGILNGTPDSLDLGVDTVEIFINDDFGNSTSYSYSINVISQNQIQDQLIFDDLGVDDAGITRNGSIKFLGGNSNPEYVDISSSSQLELSNDFSIEIWFKPIDSGSSNSVILDKGEYQIIYKPSLDIFQSGALKLKTNVLGNIDIANGTLNNGLLLKNRWNHLVITYKDSTLNSYVNSNLQKTISNTNFAVYSSISSLSIGKQKNTNDYFHGSIDDIRIWDKALSSEEILYNYSNPGKFHSDLDLNTDIIANWTFSEGVGTTTFDEGPNNLDGTISGATWDNALYWKKNTYYITQDIRLDSTVSLTIEPGSTIKLADSSSFIFYGPLIADGTKEEPITFTRMSANGNWGSVGTNNPNAQGSVFDNIIVEHGKDDTVDGQFYIGALSLYNIDADVTYSKFQYNKGDDGINYKYSNSDVIGCTFVNNFADNIDYDFTTGEIRDSYFLINEEGLDANGDGVDCGSASPYIHDNVFFNLGDKGISVGEQSYPIIKNNIIKGCYFGIACKDLSNPIIENNVIVDNHIAIASYRKKPEFGGADGQVKNCILWGNTFPDSIDIYSDLTITYSDVEGGYSGVGNIDLDPEFVNPTILDYHLSSTSPAIDSGDPTSDYSNEPEPNGFRVNLGRYGNTREAVTSTASTSQRVPLVDGYNLISWSKNTTNDSIVSVFESVIDSVELITGFSQGALIYNPSLPNFSNLNEVNHFQGYWVKFNGTDTLEVEGSSVPTNEPNPLWIGWNLVSYFPEFEDSTHNSFASILDNAEMITGFENGALAYDPNLPQFSTLPFTRPGFGYWIKLSNLDTLNYPLISSIPLTVSPINPIVSNIFTIENDEVEKVFAVKKLTKKEVVSSKSLSKQEVFSQRKSVSRGEISELKQVLASSKKSEETISEVETIEIHPTNQWVFLYGENLAPNGFPLAVGSLVTATDQNGNVCGAWEIVEEGKFGFMPVYKDDSSTQLDEGMSQGEEILVYVDGILSFNGITWDSFGDKINLGNGLVSEEESNNLLPKEYSLSQNYPNPFNPTTNIKYALPTDSKVTLTIYNTLGQEVIKLVNQKQKAGFYQTVWNGLDKNQKPVSSGVYFYKIKAGNFVKNRKMVFLK